MGADKLCPEVVLHGEKDVELTETELRLVCGDDKVEAYKEIPDYQASFLLTGFLQSRGYLRPKFETIDGVLHVQVGKKSEVKKILLDSPDLKSGSVVKKKIRQLYRHETLTPRTLDEIEKDSKRQLRVKGFPCAKVETEANAVDSSVNLKMHDLKYFPFGEVTKDPIKGLEDNALLRYYPFKAQDRYNELLLDLTEKRMLRTEVVQGTYFLQNCAPDLSTFKLSQEFIDGPPRTIRFGVGASTELGPMVRARWSHNRYGPMASILSANIQASFRQQSLLLSADNFIWKDKPRESLLSEFEVSRQSQPDFEEVLYKVKSHKKWTRDFYDRYWAWTLGPGFESGTFSSSGNSNTRSFGTGVLEGSLQYMSHIYEFFDVHPEEGDQFQFNFGFRHPTLGFVEPLLKLDVTWAKIQPVGRLGKGDLIGALRLTGSTTWVDDDVSLERLPPTVKSYGGGNDDIRGFLIRSLPRNDGLGALSKMATKLEFRKTYLFIRSLEAFTFIDGAFFGDRSWSTDPRLYYAPGLGLRWISPIGLVQAYAARAYITHPYKDEGYYLYAGLGGSF